MSAENQDESRQWTLLAAIAGGISLAILFVNYNIQNWKAASAHMHEAFIMAPDASSLPVPVDLAFMTNTLTSFGVLYEPIGRTPITGIAALEIEQERYRRGRKNSGSWRTENTTYTFAEPVKLGAVQIDANLMRHDAQEVWQGFSTTKLQNTNLHRALPLALFVGTRVYPSGSSRSYSGNQRYSFRAINAPQVVTVIGRAAPDANGQLSFSASPLMPQGYPAIWRGERSPADILKILHSRFANTMMGMAGLLFFAGWGLFVILDALVFSNNRTSKALLAGGALAATAAGLGIWYAYPVAGIAVTGVLGSFFVFYLLCRMGTVNRSSFS